MAERANTITSRIVGITDRLRPPRHGNVDVETIVKEMLRHYPDGDAELVRRAYAYAAEAHAGQKRVSGEPYITHPAAVGMLIAELGMEAATIAATVLHDVPEDTAASSKGSRSSAASRGSRATRIRPRTSGRCSSRWRMTFAS